MKTLKITILLLAICLTASANDGEYYVSGNQLVPINDTDISCAKEVLTIDLNDDGFARVDVQYEFVNNGPEKVVDMGFEANRPHNDGSEVNPSGVHPHIFDFMVTLNGERLSYTNTIIREDTQKEVTFPIDPSELEDVNYFYSYVFKARFKAGKNVIHHTYRYRMSYGIGRTFDVPYWLTPAKRWANHQIDDFTLRISTPSFKQFMIEAKLFKGEPFRVVSGKGKVREVAYKDYEDHIEIALRNGTVEWHKMNFDPSDDIDILSSDTYSFFNEDNKLGSFYDRSDRYIPRYSNEYTKEEKRILRNLPYANRGYVFKDKGLQKYFNEIWWYMPDPSWKQDTSDFTNKEWELVNEGK